MNENTDKEIVLPEGEYASYMATKAGEVADAKIREREKTWIAYIGLAVTIAGLAVAGLAALGFLNITTMVDGLVRKSVEEKIKPEVEEALPKEIEAYIKENHAEIMDGTLEEIAQNVDSVIAFVQLYHVARELEEAGVFSKDKRDLAIELLKKAARSPDIAASPEFLVALEKIIDAFAAAELWTEIDKLEDLFENHIRDSLGIVMSMILHYGKQVAGSIGIIESDVNKFNKYAIEISDAFNYPEFAAPFQLAIDVKRNKNKRTKFGEGILQDVSHYSNEETQSFLLLMDKMVEGRPVELMTGHAERTRDLFIQTHELYAHEIHELRKSVGDIDVYLDETEQIMEFLRLIEEDITEETPTEL